MVGMATPDSSKSATAADGAELGRATWPRVHSMPPRILLVPVGSCEQHGPHLPLDTDTRIAVAVASGVAAGRDDVWVAPPVAYGASGEHQAFAGTLSIGTAALSTLLVELGRSAFPPRPAVGPYRRLVFVNGHGGNHEAVGAAVQALQSEGRPATSWSPRIAGGDLHAGHTETSLLLTIAPDVVGEVRPVGATDPLPELLPRMRAGGVAAVAGNGVLGDATGASAQEGHRLLDRLVDDLEAFLTDQSG